MEERSLAVFKCTADVDAGHGRRLRREQQPVDGTLCGLATQIGCEEDPRGLPKRRLRRATRLSQRLRAANGCISIMINLLHRVKHIRTDTV